jgi:hypothetical protein
VIPTSMDEYRELFAKNLKRSGDGSEERLSVPCAFCAAPDWLEAGPEEFQHDSSPIYCIACGRSAEFRAVEHGIELHYLAGPEPPEWLEGVIMPEKPAREQRSDGYLSEAVITPHPRRLPPAIGKPHRDLRVKPTRPLNFRKTRSKTKNCHTCVHVDKVKGTCKLYGGWPVKPTDICDKWQGET